MVVTEAPMSELAALPYPNPLLGRAGTDALAEWVSRSAVRTRPMLQS